MKLLEQALALVRVGGRRPPLKKRREESSHQGLVPMSLAFSGFADESNRSAKHDETLTRREVIGTQAQWSWSSTCP